MLSPTMRMVTEGWYDEDWADFHPSETMGVDMDDQRRSDEEYDDWDARLHAYLNRDESDETIVKRWCQPDDVLDVLGEIETLDQRNIWFERMTDFRRANLHVLLTEYFGTSDYAKKNIVLKWTQVNGKFTPAETKNVVEWIEATINEKGSKLSGFASCAGAIRVKLAWRRKKSNVHHSE